jgi:hypothetical protein
MANPQDVIIRVEGTRELSELLRRASRSLDKREVQKFMIKAAKPMVDMAKQDAGKINPDKKTYRIARNQGVMKPGLIKRSIGTKVAKDTDNAVVFVLPKFKKDRSQDPWFSHFIHSGTKTRKGRGRIEGQSIVPFMDRAGSESMKQKVRNDISNMIIAKLESIGL